MMKVLFVVFFVMKTSVLCNFEGLWCSTCNVQLMRRYFLSVPFDCCRQLTDDIHHYFSQIDITVIQCILSLS